MSVEIDESDLIEKRRIRQEDLPYWPYCEECHEPIEMDPREPFGYCKCGTCEWGHPRPAKYVEDPNKYLKLYPMEDYHEDYGAVIMYEGDDLQVGWPDTMSIYYEPTHFSLLPNVDFTPAMDAYQARENHD